MAQLLVAEQCRQLPSLSTPELDAWSRLISPSWNPINPRLYGKVDIITPHSIILAFITLEYSPVGGQDYQRDELALLTTKLRLLMYRNLRFIWFITHDHCLGKKAYFIRTLEYWR